MNKIDAIRVSTAWTDSETLKNELKVELNSIEYQAILTNIDNYDTTLSYLSGIIWKYYKSYYLTTSTKERCIELLANELSGKLNYYYALINQYKEAYNKNYETIRSSENTNDRNITTSRTGFNKQATTPETIDAGAEYIDNYSTSQQKYNSSGTELGKNTFKSNISGSSKELWENINAIPKRIYEGIIGLVSKYFFYVYDDDLVPCVELTLEQAIKELNDKLNILEPKVETNSVNIKTIGGVVDDLQRQEKVMRETLENLAKVTPTDIDYNDGFTLMHDGAPITGQVNKVKLGNNLTYDEVNKTINATGGGQQEQKKYYQHTINMKIFNERIYFTLVTEDSDPYTTYQPIMAALKKISNYNDFSGAGSAYYIPTIGQHIGPNGSYCGIAYNNDTNLAYVYFTNDIKKDSSGVITSVEPKIHFGSGLSISSATIKDMVSEL